MAGNVRLAIPYGKESLKIHMPEDNLLAYLGLSHVTGAGDQDDMIASALDNPLGSGRLGELGRYAGRARRAGGVVILCDDMTRPTPVHRILPHILDRLNSAGVRDSDVKIIMANGSHRPMTREELIARVGAAIAGRIEVVNHDYRDHGGLECWGTTPGGIPIWINREVIGADLVIGIGSIVPHRYCGWSGGAKIVQPGVCGEETTVATHLMITRDPGIKLGAVENVVRHEMEEIAKRAGLAFIVNTVLNSQEEIVGCVAGDFVAAHRAGVRLAEKVCSVQVPGLADVVVIGSHPADLNFWQAGKALYSADLAVKEGGTIILVTPATEGVGEHQEFVDLLRYDYGHILELLSQHKIQDRLSAAASLAVKLVQNRAKIVLVTDRLTDEECAKMGARRYPSRALQDAIDVAIKEHGPSCKVTVLKEGADLLPRLAG